MNTYLVTFVGGVNDLQRHSFPTRPDTIEVPVFRSAHPEGFPSEMKGSDVAGTIARQVYRVVPTENLVGPMGPMHNHLIAVLYQEVS